jgi:hypothetical protein
MGKTPRRQLIAGAFVFSPKERQFAYTPAKSPAAPLLITYTMISTAI